MKMITKLQEIINYKKEEFSFRRNQTTNFELQSQIDQQKKPRKFLERLNKANKLNLIAEVKKASPSKGLIRKDFIADLVILNSNPLENIVNTLDIYSIIVDGEIYESKF